MILPYKSGLCRVIYNYGIRQDPYSHEEGVFHFGIDFVGMPSVRWNCGDIISVSDGVVVETYLAEHKQNPNWVMGNFMVIYGNDGVTTRYAHMKIMAFKKGDRVKIGDVIGTEGETGKANQRHLHLECSKGNYYVNPAEYLGIPNKCGILSVLTDYERSVMAQKKIKFRKNSYVTVQSGAVFNDGTRVPRLLNRNIFQIVRIKNYYAQLDVFDKPIGLCYLNKVKPK